jgi:chromosome segregation ATPase
VAATQRSRSNVAAIAANAASEARETGVDPREVAAAIYSAREVPARPADQAARRRRRLREQIAALERTLVELEAKHPGVAPPPAKTRQGIGPIVLEAAELERVRTDVVRRLATVQAAIDRLVSEDAAAKKESRAAPAGKPATRRRPRARPAPAGA